MSSKSGIPTNHYANHSRSKLPCLHFIISKFEAQSNYLKTACSFQWSNKISHFLLIWATEDTPFSCSSKNMTISGVIYVHPSVRTARFSYPLSTSETLREVSTSAASERCRRKQGLHRVCSKETNIGRLGFIIPKVFGEKLSV